MNLNLIITLFTIIYLSLSDNILLILDNSQLLQTHSKFITTLQQNHNLKIAYTFDKTKIQLKSYDRFKYDHVIAICLSARQSTSQFKIQEIISYFDQGGNIVIVGDIDTDKSNRKLFHAFGVQLDQYGSKLKDYFNNHLQSDILTTTNYVSTPFLTLTKPLLYQGIGLNLANYVNYQLYPLITSQSTTLSRNYIKQQTTNIGRTTLAVGVQGLNNARALLLGSLYFFSDQAFQIKEFDNYQAVQELLAWTFQKTGIIRATNMHYHGMDTFQKQTLFNVGQKISFQVQIQTQTKPTYWIPYLTNDLQVQFVMLDPWVRVPLLNINNTSLYNAEFYAPLKQGIYQFKIIYRKPGYTFLTETQRVILRPYKHDQYERFLLVAYPYQFGLSATVVSTFIFIVIYLYTKTGSEKSKQE